MRGCMRLYNSATGGTAGKVAALSPGYSSSFVVKMKDQRKPPAKGETNHASEHYPASPRATNNARKGISSVSRWRGDEQMASAERIYRKGSPDGCQGRRYLQDVVHQFQHREESLLLRRISGIGAARAHPLHGQIRRPQPSRRNAHDHRPEKSSLRNRVEHHAGGSACGYSCRGLLRRLAGIAQPPRATRLDRYSGSIEKFFTRKILPNHLLAGANLFG